MDDKAEKWDVNRDLAPKYESPRRGHWWKILENGILRGEIWINLLLAHMGFSQLEWKTTSLGHWNCLHMGKGFQCIALFFRVRCAVIRCFHAASWLLYGMCSRSQCAASVSVCVAESCSFSSFSHFVTFKTSVTTCSLGISFSRCLLLLALPASRPMLPLRLLFLAFLSHAASSCQEAILVCLRCRPFSLPRLHLFLALGYSDLSPLFPLPLS